MKDLYIIDAAGFIFRSYFAIPKLTNREGLSTNALYGFVRSMLALVEQFQPQAIVAVFDGENNKESRQAIFKDYKIHRKPIPEDLPHQIGLAKEFLRLLGIPTLTMSGVEADDTIGSLAKWAKSKDYTVYIGTSDKDLAQLVDKTTFILQPHKENRILDSQGVLDNYGVPPEQIVDFLSLTGDSSDNIPGITGFGPKTAITLLKQYGSLEKILENAPLIGGKKAEMLINEAELGKMSKVLATIHTNVVIPQDETFYQIQPAQWDDLYQFYEKMDFKSLARQAASQVGNKHSLPDNSITTKIIDSEEDILSLIDLIQKAQQACFDTETTDIDPLKASIVGIGFSLDGSTSYYIPLYNKLPKGEILFLLKSIFEDPSIKWIGHNLKYDMHTLSNEGIELAIPYFDTMLASYLISPEERRHSLEYVSLSHLGRTKIPIENLIGKGKKQLSMLDVPIEKVAEYCGEDAALTYQLKIALEKLLEQRGLNSLFHDLEMPLIKVLFQMERHGIFLDCAMLEEFSTALRQQIEQLENQTYALAGESFNLSSPKQLGEILFQKLGIHVQKKGKTGPSTAADVLESLIPDYPIAEKILEWRSLEKLRSTYAEALPYTINPKTGRIHCHFNQSMTATGRLSCQDPNLQNIPVRTELGRRIRQAFRPEHKNWSYLSADYSQLELRILAHLCEDPILVSAFANNEDVHSSTASEIFGVPLKDVTPEMRYRAKAVNFGILYGQQAYGLSQGLHIPPNEAAAFIKLYFQRFKRVKEFIEECKETTRKTGKATTFTGRERPIPDINSKNQIIRAAAERLAVNTPIQGAEADLIKMAMLNIDNWLKSNQYQGFMVLQIHDELLFEVPDVELEIFSPKIHQLMETVYPMRVPLLVQVSIGKNWKEC